MNFTIKERARSEAIYHNIRFLQTVSYLRHGLRYDLPMTAAEAIRIGAEMEATRIMGERVRLPPTKPSPYIIPALNYLIDSGEIECPGSFGDEPEGSDWLWVLTEGSRP